MQSDYGRGGRIIWVLKAKYVVKDNFKGLKISGEDVNIKLVGDRLNIENLLDCLYVHGIIDLEKTKEV